MGTILGYAAIICIFSGHWIIGPIIAVIAIIVGIAKGAKEFQERK